MRSRVEEIARAAVVAALPLSSLRRDNAMGILRDDVATIEPGGILFYRSQDYMLVSLFDNRPMVLCCIFLQSMTYW